MLYKNLPPDDLASVMRVRAVLDYVAVLSFILKGQFSNALAVLRARRAYASLRASFVESRKENMKKHAFPLYPNGQKQYLGTVLFTREEVLFPIVRTLACF